MDKAFLKSSSIVTVMTFLSRVLGLVRDYFIARYFGANGFTDAFLVAFKIPNFLRRLFGEGAFSQALVPILAETKANHDEEEVQNVINHIGTKFLTILIVITIISVVLAPLVILVFAWGFYFDADPTKFDLASSMLRITFPYLLLISLTAFAGSILNTYDKFAVPAFTPVLLNISMILSAVYLSQYLETPIMALAWGVLIGGVVQLLFQIPFLIKIKKLPHLTRGDHPSVKTLKKRMLPALFGVSVSQINLLLDTIIASFLISGSISWLYYADRLIEFPLGVFGVALATVVLPSLSQDHATDNTKAFAKKIDWSLRVVLLMAAPAAVGLFLLAEPMLITLFEYGEFNTQDTSMSGWALKAYSLGLLAFIFIKVLANGYFSRQDTKTPVKIGIIAMVVNMGLNLLFVLPMIYYDFVAPHMGLALATTGSAIVNAVLLYRGLSRQGVYTIDNSWLRYALKITVALFAMGLCIALLNPSLTEWHGLGASQRVLQLSGIILAAIGIYFVALASMNIHFWKIKDL